MSRLVNRRFTLALAAVPFALHGVACSDDPIPQLAETSVAVATVGAADPKLPGFDGWPLRFDVVVQGFGDALAGCQLVLSRDGAVVRSLDAAIVASDASEPGAHCAAIWDGRDADGVLVGPGLVQLRNDLVVDAEVRASAEQTLEVVRLGIDSVSLTGPEAAPLLYGAMDGQERGYYTIAADQPQWRIGPDASEPTGAVSLEHADGTVRALPEPWDDLRSPPLDEASQDGAEHDTYNLPAAFAAGSAIDVTATLTSDLAGAPGSGAPSLYEVRLVPPADASFVGDGTGAFEHGASVAVRLDNHPVQGVGRYDLELQWRFEARLADGDWVAVPGAIVTVHRIYGLVAVPTFLHSTQPHTTWVDVIDRVASWVDGQTADPVAVAARVVQGVYFEMDLVYDRESGASSYTSYPGFGWGRALFDLSSFLDRDEGNIINCSDAASISATFITMAGVDFRYHILERPGGTRFDLNYIMAIGWDEFDETPFFGDRGAFSYHAVVGPTDGSFYDATLQLDGDEDPTSPPHVALLATGMVPQAYIEALSSEWQLVDVLEDQQVEIR